MATTNEKIGLQLDLRGIDMVTPVDLLSDGRTPWSKNFRLYAKQADSRQVAVSSRKGPGYYMTPLSEALLSSDTDTGDGETKVGVTGNIVAQRIVAGNTGRMNRIDLRIARDENPYGPVIISLYSDIDGRPSKLLAKTSISNGDISDSFTWQTARFHNAPEVTTGDDIWAVIEIQDDGGGTYKLETVAGKATAQFSEASFSALAPVSWGINYRSYFAPNQTSKNGFRFNRENGQNLTVVAYGSTLYSLNAGTNTWDIVQSGLNPAATEYSFATADGRVLWSNGYDNLKAWEGTLQSAMPQLVANGSFSVDTAGWSNTAPGTPVGTASIARNTTEFQSAPASLLVSAGTTDTRRAVLTGYTLVPGKTYNYSYWIRGATVATNTFPVIYGTATTELTKNIVGTTWTQITGSFKAKAGDTSFAVVSTSAGGTVSNFYLDNVSLVEQAVEDIIDPELPILDHIIFHKDRLFGRVANDKNKFIWSEAPGNPSNVPSYEQWYRAYLSTSFWYVPAPKTGSPITGMESFQDSLFIFTQDNKYVFSGYDKGSFNLRQSTGSKGALSFRSITKDENYIFFVANDGMYMFNGSKDENISETRIQPLFDACPRKDSITPITWNNKVRWYMASQTSSVNDICALYNIEMEEWELDTDVYIDRAVKFDDTDDNNELLEFSSLYAMPMLAEVGYSSLGSPIDFEYRFKYDSMGLPAQKKRLRRYYPILQGVDNTFNIQLAMDKDFQDNPRVKDVLLSVNGAKWGQFKWGDGTTWGGDKSFKHHRQSYSGSAYYWQLRVSRNGVNNRVAFVGAQYKYRIKRM